MTTRKEIGRKFFVGMLCLTMVLALAQVMSLNVRAAGPVAKLYDAGDPNKQVGAAEGYDSLQDALTAASELGAYTIVSLQQDVSVSGQMSLTQDINLFLNGHTLTLESGSSIKGPVQRGGNGMNSYETAPYIDVMSAGSIVCAGDLDAEVEAFAQGVSVTVLSGGHVDSLAGEMQQVTVAGGSIGFLQSFGGTYDITGAELVYFCVDDGTVTITDSRLETFEVMNNMGSPVVTVSGSTEIQEAKFEYYGFLNSETNQLDSGFETVTISGNTAIHTLRAIIDGEADGVWGSLTVNGGYFGNHPGAQEMLSEYTQEVKAHLTYTIDESAIETYSGQNDWTADPATYVYRIKDPNGSGSNGGGQEPINYVVDGIDYSPVYNGTAYGQINQDVAAYFQGDEAAMLAHFVNYGMTEGRQASPEFNVYVYMQNYQDLANAFGSDLRSYYLHYIQYGKSEGRVADVSLNPQGGGENGGNGGNGGNSGSGLNAADYADVFDASFYYNTYADLQEYIGNDPDALLAHFVAGGMAEGRQGNAEFHVQIYMTKYEDLAGVFGSDLTAYYMHYINSGKAEGRTASPAIYSRVYNFDYYLQANADLAAVFAGNEVAAFNHFLNAGMGEKRVASAEFNVNVYRAENADLNSAFGDNIKLYFLHYMDGGYAEPRTAH